MLDNINIKQDPNNGSLVSHPSLDNKHEEIIINNCLASLKGLSVQEAEQIISELYSKIKAYSLIVL
jgi:hypothetical protein